MKSLIKRALRSAGWELCRLYPTEVEKLPQDARFSFREAQAYLALSNLGQLSLEEARLLQELVRASDASRPIVEIGTLFGFSTTVIALAKQPQQLLISVDNYSWNPLGLTPEAHFATTSNRLSEATKHHNVQMLRITRDA